MTASDQWHAKPGQPDTPRREPIWFILWWACFCGFWAWRQASYLEAHGFSWWGMASIIFMSVSAGLWLGELPPWRRLMAWRVRRYGGVPNHRVGA